MKLGGNWYAGAKLDSLRKMNDDAARDRQHEIAAEPIRAAMTADADYGWGEPWRRHTRVLQEYVRELQEYIAELEQYTSQNAPWDRRYR